MTEHETATVAQPPRSKGKVYVGFWMDKKVVSDAESIVKAEHSSISQFCRTAFVREVDRLKKR